MKPSVAYWNNIPAPYMVDRFNAVVRRGNLNFSAWFNQRSEPDRSWTVDERQWAFSYRYLPSLGIGGRSIVLPLPAFSERPDLLVTLYAEPSFVVGSTGAKLRGIATAYWVEVTFDAWFPRRAWKEAMKRRLFASVDGIITCGPDGRDFARRYGAEDDRIWEARHSIDVGAFSKAASNARPRRDAIRAEIGIPAGAVAFVYVGRFWSGKGIPHLIEAYARLVEQQPDVALVLVGSGPEESALRRQVVERGLRNVVFAGFHHPETLVDFYVAADVFVFPTLGDPYGLVVDEAMACGLPIVSTSAAGEIGLRVVEGDNGFIVPPADADALCRRMETLAANAAGRQTMGERSVAMIQGHTPDRWADRFEVAVDGILARRQ